MNEEIIKIIREKKLHPIGYKKINSVYYIRDKDKKYILKLNTNNYDIYKYLISRDFSNFPHNYNNFGDNYDLSEYIEDIKMEKEQKLNDLLVTLALLHKKTTYKRKIDLDDIKKIYEDINKIIDYRMRFYTKLNDQCDSEEFLSPSKYLLVRNISLIYYLLDYAKKEVNLWYESIKSSKSIIVSLLHNNISLDHFIVNQNKYLINWDNAFFDNPILDIISFYKLYYKDISLNDIFLIYEKNNYLDQLAKKLLLIYLMIGNDIKLGKNELLNSKIINNELLFLEKVYEYIKSMGVIT